MQKTEKAIPKRLNVSLRVSVSIRVPLNLFFNIVDIHQLISPSEVAL